jgi:hypothetical protein
MASLSSSSTSAGEDRVTAAALIVYRARAVTVAASTPLPHTSPMVSAQPPVTVWKTS